MKGPCVPHFDWQARWPLSTGKLASLWKSFEGAESLWVSWAQACSHLPVHQNEHVIVSSCHVFGGAGGNSLDLNRGTRAEAVPVWELEEPQSELCPLDRLTIQGTADTHALRACAQKRRPQDGPGPALWDWCSTHTPGTPVKNSGWSKLTGREGSVDPLEGAFQETQHWAGWLVRGEVRLCAQIGPFKMLFITCTPSPSRRGLGRAGKQ